MHNDEPVEHVESKPEDKRAAAQLLAEEKVEGDVEAPTLASGDVSSANGKDTTITIDPGDKHIVDADKDEDDVFFSRPLRRASPSLRGATFREGRADARKAARERKLSFSSGLATEVVAARRRADGNSVREVAERVSIAQERAQRHEPPRWFKCALTGLPRLVALRACSAGGTHANTLAANPLRVAVRIRRALGFDRFVRHERTSGRDARMLLY